MDERLNKALNFSNFMVTLNNQKRLLKEKFEESLLFFYNGSQFTVSKELITFVNLLKEKGIETAVLIDDNNLPVEVLDISDFLDSILNSYFTASNEYLIEYEKIKKNRKIIDLVEYNNE